MSIENSRRGLLLGAAAVIVAVAVAVYFFSRQSGGAKPSAAVVATPTAGTPTAPAASAASPPATAAETPAVATAPPATILTVPELLKDAAKALSEERLVEPAGNNAVEYYLLVLDRDKDNVSARDGLREMFPLATGAVEQQINAGQIDASARMINLLSKSDPTNYTLTILRNKLDLKKRQVERDQQKRDQEKQLAANAAHNAPATTAAPAPAVPATTAPAPPPVAASTSAASAAAPAPNPATQAAAAPAAANNAKSPAPAAGGENRAATLVQKTNPSYPVEAARRREEGWVEVGFVVGPDGHVKDATVIGANPARIFNESALRAVANWTFQPRLENGKPVEEHVKSRIEFKLGAG